MTSLLLHECAAIPTDRVNFVKIGLIECFVGEAQARCWLFRRMGIAGQSRKRRQLSIADEGLSKSFCCSHLRVL